MVEYMRRHNPSMDAEVFDAVVLARHGQTEWNAAAVGRANWTPR